MVLLWTLPALLLQLIMNVFGHQQLHIPGNNVAELLDNPIGFKDDTPIFVVGMARSGSTLIEQILSSHPDVFGAGQRLFRSILARMLACPGYVPDIHMIASAAA